MQLWTIMMLQVSKVNIESGERLWINCDIEKPGSVAADRYGSVYVLVKPSDICILNSNTGMSADGNTAGLTNHSSGYGLIPSPSSRNWSIHLVAGIE